MLYFHLKLISVACPIREKDESHTLTIAGYRSPPSLLLGATAGRAWLESSASPLRQPQPGHHLPQNFPNQTRQTLFKPPSILINITEWKAALDHAALGPDLVWCQLSESSCLTPPLHMRYLTPSLLICMTLHFSKAGFEMSSFFLLKAIFTSEMAFKCPFCQSLSFIKVTYFRQHHEWH